MRTPRSLYVHIPFCLSICPYCDFVVYGRAAARGPTSQTAAFVKGLEAEIELRAPADPRPLLSVYFGGGTPSLLPAAQVGGLLDLIDRSFGIAAAAEITLECNPGSRDRGDLAGFRSAGVNRLSIGAQSLDAEELRRLGRRHAPADIAESATQARQAGFDNVSLDLLYDVPGQTLESWQATLETAIDLAPDHLSLYALTLDDPDAEGLTGPTGDHLPLRAGARRWRRRAAEDQDEARAADCYALADDLLSAAGYGCYEISNWARPGRASRHNLAYWTAQPYEAVGPGAHAFDGALTRRWNAARLDSYIAALAEGRLPPGASETIDAQRARAERVILQLRTSLGLTASQAAAQAYEPALAWGRAMGMVESGADGRMRLTLRGRLLSNELFARLLPEPSASLVA